MLLIAALVAGAVPGAAEAPPELLAGADAPAPWWAGELSVLAGFDLSRGDYGDPIDTTILYVPLTFVYLPDDFPLTPNPWDQVEFAITVPYLRIDGPGDFFVPERGVSELRRRTEEGLGDVFLRGSYIWYPPVDTWLPVSELSARYKIPTADADRGLGTGAGDFILQVDLARSFGRITPSLSAGYRFVGEPPDGTLDNAWFASLGASVRLLPRLSAGVYYDWLQASSPFREDAHELLAYTSFDVSPRVALRPYVGVGLAGDAPAWAVGMTLRWNLPIGR